MHHRFLGRVGNIDHDSDPVHFGDDEFAEGREPVPFPTIPFAGVGVRELIVAVVRQRQIPRATIIELFDSADVLADGIAILDAHQSGLFAQRVDATHVAGGHCQLHIVGSDLKNETAHRLELFNRRVVGALVACGLERIRILRLPCLADVNDKEQRVKTAVVHFRQIELGFEALRVISLTG